MTDPQYPNGKLNENDEGELQMMITQENGCVVMHFNKPTAWISMPPEQAIEMAQVLIDHARALNPSLLLTITLGRREAAGQA
jgi:hypothetical protein